MGHPKLSAKFPINGASYFCLFFNLRPKNLRSKTFPYDVPSKFTEMSAIVKGNEEREVDNEMGIKRGWRKWGGNIQNKKGMTIIYLGDINPLFMGIYKV